MDLIQSYHDQGSQSSSSGDDTKFLQKNAAAPSTSYSNEITMPKMVSTFEPLERIPLDRLMIASAAIAAQKSSNQKQKQKQAESDLAVWLSDTEKELRMCLGSINPIQKHTILETMDHFISKLTKDYEKISKPIAADLLSQYIRTYLHICRYLFRSLEKGKRYYKRFIRLLSIYTDLELCASLRAVEYDKKIAERICLVYQTYLDHSDNSMVLDVLLNTKRLWRQHSGILVLLFEYFLVRKTPIELPDALFMKNLYMFKKWLYIENVPEERRKARDAFVTFIKPKKTICMNSLYKPYLPVDKEGFVTIESPIDILNKDYSLAPLIRCLRKAEMRAEVHQSEEVIVLTDDENDNDEDDSYSHQGPSSASCSHYNDEMSNDFDWYSASSQQDQQYSQNIIETVSIDSPPPPQNRKSPSMSSLDSCDLDLDTNHSLSTDRNGESAQQITELQQKSRDLPTETNGDGNNRNLPTLDESMFNRLVNDINSTHVSIPSNGNTSSDGKIIENGESSQPFDIVNNLEPFSRTENRQFDKSNNVENEQLNGVMTRASEPIPCSSNSDSSLTTLSSENNLDLVTSEASSTVQQNHNFNSLKSVDVVEAVKHCDNTISASNSLLRNHEETLKNVDEVVNNDLKNHEKSSGEYSTSNDVQMSSESNKADTASNQIHEINDAEAVNEAELHQGSGNMEIVQEILPSDFVPAAESTASIINDTSLLSKSEQAVLFIDQDAALIYNDLCGNEPAIELPKPEGNQSQVLYKDDSPILFMANGTDQNRQIKTYSRRPMPEPPRIIETKTISTQTSRYSLSGCPSPVITMEEDDSTKRNRHLLIDREDDEIVSNHESNAKKTATRSNYLTRVQSPVRTMATRNASMPMASTSSGTPNISVNLQTATNASTGEVVVKRKRGRPRKYPLPEPGTTPVPKTPKAPRRPRQPKPPKEPNETDGEPVVFEKRVLRARKPKPIPEPEIIVPKVRKQVRKQVQKEVRKQETDKQKRIRRRNTIKMTIDAIFNTQSPQIRAIQARRISQILGIPMNSQKIATILKRHSYNKTININNSMNSDSSLNDTSMLQTFKNRSNGQMNSTINETSGPQHSTSSTILARKTYIKPNITISSFSAFSSAIRRLSFSSRRMSFASRRISISATKRSNKRATSPRKSHSQQQHYTKIDIFDTSKKRGRKKGSKDSAPRKKSSRKTKAERKNITAESITPLYPPIVEIGDKVNESIEIVDLTNNKSDEFAQFGLDTSDEMQNQFANIHTALSSTQHIQNSHSISMPPQRRNFPSEDTETDFTNELTTDPESTVEDTDDSCTRKSKRCRKIPKILDL